jgi:hypothetical protein
MVMPDTTKVFSALQEFGQEQKSLQRSENLQTLSGGIYFL